MKLHESAISIPYPNLMSHGPASTWCKYSKETFGLCKISYENQINWSQLWQWKINAQVQYKTTDS